MGLFPENLLAWELYHQGRIEALGPLILELRTIELSEREADELASKLVALAVTYGEIEQDEAKRRRDEAELRRRQSGGRT